MSEHVHVIDATQHQAFLKQQRKDPVIKEPFKHGDHIIICAVCRSAFLEESWQAIGSIHCAQRETLPAIEGDAEHSRFTKPRAQEAAPGKAPPTPQVPLTAPDKKEAAGHTQQHPAPVSMRLREIPIQLRPALRLRDFE